MKQIANWVFGSFFRTIGRLLVFVLLGVIIANLIDFDGIKDSFSITDLFFTNVKADTLSTTYWNTYYNDSAKTQQLSYTGNYGTIDMSANGNGLTTKDIYVNNYFVYDTNKNYVLIPIMLLGQTAHSDTNSIDKEVICDWDLQQTSDGYTAQAYNCQLYATGTNSAYYNVNVSLKISIRTSIGVEAPCKIENEMAKCYLQKNYAYNIIRVEYNMPVANNSYTLKLGIKRSTGIYYDAQNAIVNEQQQTNQAITNQTQQQEQQHQEMMDSNTTQAEDEASDFFDDFSVPDVGGLSAVITAPLNTIRSLLNSSCTNLSVPLPFMENKYLTLPCMAPIYNEHFGAFFTLYQTIILGIVAYRCIKSIFFDIKGFTDPNDGRIEVMDL